MPHHLVGTAEIAEMLGVSRQRVAQLISSYDDFPKPEVELTGGRVWSRTAVEAWISAHPERSPEIENDVPSEKMEFGFSRMTDVGRRAIVLAQEQARRFKHNYIGTEHLLLGVLAIEEGAAWRALDSLDVTIDAVADHLGEMIGYGHDMPQGHIPFTPRAKKVLELSFREALTLADEEIGPEHILLALVREGDGVAWQILEKLGLSKKEVRNVTIESSRSWVPPKRKKSKRKRVEEIMACSFCGKTQLQVTKLIAGPGVYICNECVALCDQIIEEETGEPPKATPPDDMRERLADLERRLRELESRD